MEQTMKAKLTPKHKTGFIGKLARRKGVVSRKPIEIKKSKIEILEDRLDYQAIKADSYKRGSKTRQLWQDRADITRLELKKISGV